MKIKVAINNLLNKFGYRVSRTNEVNMPIEATKRDLEILGLVREYTMTSHERIWALMSAIRYVTTLRMSGDFVECGVWRGGSAMVMALTLLDLGLSNKKIWLYDTYEGMTEPTSEDIEFCSGELAETLLRRVSKKSQARDIWCFSQIDDVATNLRSTGYPMSNVNLIKGDVLHTLNVDIPDQISLLRLDTDWYYSTKKELELLYPKLQTGGVCIIDDYGYWGGSKKAVDEYLKDNEISVLLHRIDNTARLFIKP